MAGPSRFRVFAEQLGNGARRAAVQARAGVGVASQAGRDAAGRRAEKREAKVSARITKVLRERGETPLYEARLIRDLVLVPLLVLLVTGASWVISEVLVVLLFAGFLVAVASSQVFVGRAVGRDRQARAVVLRSRVQRLWLGHLIVAVALIVVTRPLGVPFPLVFIALGAFQQWLLWMEWRADRLVGSERKVTRFVGFLNKRSPSMPYTRIQVTDAVQPFWMRVLNGAGLVELDSSAQSDDLVGRYGPVHNPGAVIGWLTRSESAVEHGPNESAADPGDMFTCPIPPLPKDE